MKLKKGRSMNDQKQLVKIIETYAGNVYAYVPASNQILTLDKTWFNDIPPEERYETVVSALADGGVDLHSQAEQYVFNFSLDKLWNDIEHHVKSLTLEVTQQCTLRCAYCIYSGNYTNERQHSGLYMSLDMMKKCIDYYYNHSTEENEASISFYGGESLLQFKDMQMAIEYARNKWKDKKIAFNISTNGTTLTQPILRYLNEQQDITIAITCNGEMHDEYRVFPNGSGSLKAVMHAVECIRNDYPSLWERTYFIANVASKGELLSLRKFYMEKIGKPPTAITGIKTEYGNERIAEIVHQEDTEKDAEEVFRLYCEGDPYILPYVDVDGICKRRVGPEKAVETRATFCKPLAHELYIAADGKFRTCEQMCSALEFGHVDTGYSKEKVLAMLERVQKAFAECCRSCWGRRLCYTCYSDINLDGQGKLAFPEASCRAECAEVAYALRAFCEMGERNPERLREIADKQKKTSGG